MTPHYRVTSTDLQYSSPDLCPFLLDLHLDLDLNPRLLDLDSPFAVWPHLFCGAGHEKRKGEQLKWSMSFTLYIESFPCA